LEALNAQDMKVSFESGCVKEGANTFRAFSAKEDF
jgi:hypothetical protein